MKISAVRMLCFVEIFPTEYSLEPLNACKILKFVLILEAARLVLAKSGKKRQLTVKFKQTDSIVDLGSKIFKLEQGSTEIAQETVEETIKSNINRPASSCLKLPK